MSHNEPKPELESSLPVDPAGKSAPMSNFGRDMNMPLIVVVSVCSVLVVFVAIVLIQVLYFSQLQREEAVKSLGQESFELMQNRQIQLQRLNRVEWVDVDAEKVSIPIDRAVELFIRDENAARN